MTRQFSCVFDRGLLILGCGSTLIIQMMTKAKYFTYLTQTYKKILCVLGSTTLLILTPVSISMDKIMKSTKTNYMI